MKGAFIAGLIVVVWAGSASAQVPNKFPGDRLAWDQAAGSAAEAQGYVYRATVDSDAPVQVVNVVCTDPANASGEFPCVGDFPSTTPTQHSLTLTAETTVDGTVLTSLPSNPFVFVTRIAPASPSNVRKQ